MRARIIAVDQVRGGLIVTFNDDAAVFLMRSSCTTIGMTGNGASPRREGRQQDRIGSEAKPLCSNLVEQREQMPMGAAVTLLIDQFFAGVFGLIKEL